MNLIHDQHSVNVPAPFIGLCSSNQQQQKTGYTPLHPNISPFLACVEMNLTFYDVTRAQKIVDNLKFSASNI